MAVFGFIGTGNMGGALAGAASRTIAAENILLSDRMAEKAEELAKTLGCRAVGASEAAEAADYIFLGVKPQMMQELLQELQPVLAGRKDRFVLVTMAAGLTMDAISSMTGGSYPIIRIMPNLAVSIGKGMILYCRNGAVTDGEMDAFLQAMRGAGRFSELPEKLIDAGSAVSGCGPAFVDLFVEAMADGGVACGLPRKAALEYAAQMVVGAAQLILDKDQHPGVLKDAVCSPGGTTIQGVRALEKGGFRSAVMEAVIAAFEKNAALK